jgi:hypothetical protein
LALFGWNFDCLQERVSGSRYTRDRNLGETGLLEIARAGNGVQPKSERKIRPQHRISAAKERVPPQHRREPGKQSSVDEVREVSAMQVSDAKLPLGQGARPGRQTHDEVSAAVVMNSDIGRIEGGLRGVRQKLVRRIAISAHKRGFEGNPSAGALSSSDRTCSQVQSG